MVGGIYGSYNAGSMRGIQSYLSQKPASTNNFDYKAAQNEAKALIEKYKQGQGKTTALKKDTAAFLDEYQKSVKSMGDAANAVKGENFDRLLYGTGGKNSTPTDANIEKTAKAIEEMTKQFNSTLATLNKNTDRGAGVSKQIERMVSSPTSERSMELLGITTTKDGSLKVDMDKLKESLKTNTQVARDVIGGSFGVAQGISRDSTNGLNQSPISLVGNDIAAIKETQIMGQVQDVNSMAFMSNYSKTGAINMMNLNSIGLLMNITA
ncbi:MAG: hypothetical protein RR049_07840 [Angelakisella sp.]